VQVALLEVSGMLGLQRISNEPLRQIAHDLRLIGRPISMPWRSRSPCWR
jgi:hypothetical protein